MDLKWFSTVILENVSLSSGGLLQMTFVEFNESWQNNGMLIRYIPKMTIGTFPDVVTEILFLHYFYVGIHSVKSMELDANPCCWEFLYCQIDLYFNTSGYYTTFGFCHDSLNSANSVKFIQGKLYVQAKKTRMPQVPHDQLSFRNSLTSDMCDKKIPTIKKLLFCFVYHLASTHASCVHFHFLWQLYQLLSLTYQLPLTNGSFFKSFVQLDELNKKNFGKSGVESRIY